MIIPLSYSIAEAAQQLRIGKTKFYELALRGEIAIRKIGTRSVVLRKDLENFVETLESQNRSNKHSQRRRSTTPNNSRNAPEGK